MFGAKWTATLGQLGVFLLLAVAGTSVHAQSSTVPKLDSEGRRGDVARLAKQRSLEKFNAADVNDDEKLSKEEIANNFPFLAEKFLEHDKNGEGFLSWEEYLGHDRWKR